MIKIAFHLRTGFILCQSWARIPTPEDRNTQTGGPRNVAIIATLHGILYTAPGFGALFRTLSDGGGRAGAGAAAPPPRGPPPPGSCFFSTNRGCVGSSLLVNAIHTRTLWMSWLAVMGGGVGVQLFWIQYLATVHSGQQYVRSIFSGPSLYSVVADTCVQLDNSYILSLIIPV